MTKKHFEAIAAIINKYANPVYGRAGREVVRKDIAKDLAAYFSEENPNFGRERFLAACGIK